MLIIAFISRKMPNSLNIPNILNNPNITLIIFLAFFLVSKNIYHCGGSSDRCYLLLYTTTTTTTTTTGGEPIENRFWEVFGGRRETYQKQVLGGRPIKSRFWEVFGGRPIKSRFWEGDLSKAGFGEGNQSYRILPGGPEHPQDRPIKSRGSQRAKKQDLSKALFFFRAQNLL